MKINILIIFLTNSILAISQTNFQQGYIVKSNGEEIPGLIDYRGWGNNPYKIAFKLKLEDETNYFKPLDIKEFRVHNDIYRSSIVKKEVSTILTTELDNSSSFVYQSDTAFLKAVIIGDKSIFYLKDKLNKQHFYILKDSVFELLEYKRYFVEYNGIKNVIENKKYIGQLILYFGSHLSNSEINITRYTYNSLLNLFSKYYKKQNLNPLYKKEVEMVKAKFGVLTGGTVTTISFSSEVFQELSKSNFPSSTNFTLGAFLELILPRNQKKWSIQNEILFTSMQTSGEYFNYKSKNEYSHVNTSFKFSYLKLINMIRFSYPIRRAGLFANLGLTNGILVQSKNYKREQTQFYSLTNDETGKALNELRAYEQGFILGLGVKFKKISLEYRFELGNGFSAYSNLNTSIYRNYFLLGYTF